MMKRLLTAAALMAASPLLMAEALTGEVQKQATNWTAIGMFVIFILFTMGITKWAAKRNTSTSDYYTAGGSITGAAGTVRGTDVVLNAAGSVGTALAALNTAANTLTVGAGTGVFINEADAVTLSSILSGGPVSIANGAKRNTTPK